MSERRCIETDKAPPPIGPYCQGNIAGPFVFTAAVGGVGTTIIEQTRQALLSLKAILAAGGCELRDVAKVTVYLANLKDFKAMNDVYKEYFQQPFPARAIIESNLPAEGALVAFDAVALRP